ncbi:M23 family metallopeptidase [Streptomyces sp. NBC_00536]|uniref:M23 family metallopeptidase n=1 Tax=Streptomyces sp. NBC_00536 TaxID=2975769 RepID=UPI002E81FBC3|nr:M23 family metallopeptidase [Streptomyces sp. NBC_00536]WUC80762.1 M23 family metallopeptidase [Streptomyces sp. NBC_00536]
MNDSPTSGQYPENGYDGLSTTTFAGDVPYASFETQGQGYNYGAYAASYDTGSYDTGGYDTTAWNAPVQDGYLSSIPTQTAAADTSGHWDTTAWSTDHQPVSFGYDGAAAPTGDQSGHWAMPGYGTTGTETGAYDATAWNTVVPEELPQQLQPEAAYAYGQQDYGDAYGHGHAYEYAYAATTVTPTITPAYEDTYKDSYEAPYEDAYAAPHDGGYAPAPESSPATAVFEAVPSEDEGQDEDTAAEQAGRAAATHAELPTQTMATTPPVPRSARRAAAPAKGNGGRRSPAKRSALLTVAVPSVCVIGVAGVAAAAVGGLPTGDKPSGDTTTMAAPDPASVKPVAANSKLDTQLAALSADAGDFADRASRTQERIDLKERQDLEKKKRAEEAAAKEAARPKFSLPVEQHGLSAGFGQAGGMWMSVHTGIDFPVSYGTPVMAATDGTVRTQWNSAYGNMAIVVSPDGTETWYCHLSSTKIRSGKVKAGDVIAYSGNSGNSTGPHLHFEVRPDSGSPIDPQAWLRSHGLDPN